MSYTPTKFKDRCNNPSCYIKLTPKNIQNMALDLYHYLCKNNLEVDTFIYFKQKDKWNCITYDKPSDKEYDELTYTKNKANDKYYFIKDITPPIEWTGETLCMTFEGSLYDEYNYGNGEIEIQLDNFFSHYGLYSEMGYAWSLALYPL